MRIICTICTDPVTEDLAAAPCGHTFHFTCLSQWLARRKTCPQCRKRCLPSKVLKLFINDSSDSLQCENDVLNQQELKDKLKHKDQALSEARATLEQIKEEVQAWKKRHGALHKKLRKEKATNSTLTKQLEVLQYECECVKTLEKEAAQLREKLSTMEGIQKVLTSSMEEVDVLVKTYQSTSQLASFLVVLRRDYDALKASKSAVKEEKDRLAQEITYLKRKLNSKEEELQSARSQLTLLEIDLHAAEKESLARKVEMLGKAQESLESNPMPDPSARTVPADLGESPLLVSRKNSTEQTAEAAGKQNNHPVVPSKIGSKRMHENNTAVIQLNKNSTRRFYGMGRRSRFIIPKPRATAPVKGLRFALRGIQSQQHPRAPGLLLGVVKESELQLDLAGEGSSAVAGRGTDQEMKKRMR